MGDFTVRIDLLEHLQQLQHIFTTGRPAHLLLIIPSALLLSSFEAGELLDIMSSRLSKCGCVLARAQLLAYARRIERCRAPSLKNCCPSLANSTIGWIYFRKLPLVHCNYLFLTVSHSRCPGGTLQVFSVRVGGFSNKITSRCCSLLVCVFPYPIQSTFSLSASTILTKSLATGEVAPNA